MAKPAFDGQYVFCAALVPSLMAENIAVKIRVNCEYELQNNVL